MAILNARGVDVETKRLVKLKAAELGLTMGQVVSRAVEAYCAKGFRAPTRVELREMYESLAGVDAVQAMARKGEPLVLPGEGNAGARDEAGGGGEKKSKTAARPGVPRAGGIADFGALLGDIGSSPGADAEEQPADRWGALGMVPVRIGLPIGDCRVVIVETDSTEPFPAWYSFRKSIFTTEDGAKGFNPTHWWEIPKGMLSGLLREMPKEFSGGAMQSDVIYHPPVAAISDSQMTCLTCSACGCSVFWMDGDQMKCDKCYPRPVDGKPSAADLDAVAAEEKARALTLINPWCERLVDDDGTDALCVLAKGHDGPCSPVTTIGQAEIRMPLWSVSLGMYIETPKAEGAHDDKTQAAAVAKIFDKMREDSATLGQRIMASKEIEQMKQMQCVIVEAQLNILKLAIYPPGSTATERAAIDAALKERDEQGAARSDQGRREADAASFDDRNTEWTQVWIDQLTSIWKHRGLKAAQEYLRGVATGIITIDSALRKGSDGQGTSSEDQTKEERVSDGGRKGSSDETRSRSDAGGRGGDLPGGMEPGSTESGKGCSGMLAGGQVDNLTGSRRSSGDSQTGQASEDQYNKMIEEVVLTIDQVLREDTLVAGVGITEVKTQMLPRVPVPDTPVAVPDVPRYFVDNPPTKAELAEILKRKAEEICGAVQFPAPIPRNENSGRHLLTARSGERAYCHKHSCKFCFEESRNRAFKSNDDFVAICPKCNKSPMRSRDASLRCPLCGYEESSI